MQTVVLTDAKYRMSIAAARSLGRAGFRVVCAQAEGDISFEPPVFSSRYVAASHLLPGKSGDASYRDALLELLSGLDRPVLLPVGAATLALIARDRGAFAAVSRFLIASPDVLDSLNDKACVHARCLELGIPVPKQFSESPDTYPVIVKPHCGEKAGLKAADRYAVAENDLQLEAALTRLRAYDPAPIVQQKVSGDGFGASLLLDADSRLVGAICHRRIREYPVSGGPSTCCESVFDAAKIDQACRLLSSFGFQGLAMVEFKGDHVLEVNPRLWGSFPLTACCGSPLAVNYARAAMGETLEYAGCDYQTGVRMRFAFNDAAAALSNLKHGNFAAFGSAVLDVFRAREAFRDPEDPAPARAYARTALRR